MERRDERYEASRTRNVVVPAAFVIFALRVEGQLSSRGRRKASFSPPASYRVAGIYPIAENEFTSMPRRTPLPSRAWSSIAFTLSSEVEGGKLPVAEPNLHGNVCGSCAALGRVVLRRSRVELALR